MLVVLNVVYVLIAIAMIALILMQRGAGASAGSGFGAGASATVFGATGAGNFLSKATKWLAIVFFSISLYMAWHATDRSADTGVTADLGVMAQVPVAPEGVAPVPAAAVPAPAAVAPAVPAATSGSDAQAPATQSPESTPSEPAGE